MSDAELLQKIVEWLEVDNMRSIRISRSNTGNRLVVLNDELNNRESGGSGETLERAFLGAVEMSEYTDVAIESLLRNEQ